MNPILLRISFFVLVSAMLFGGYSNDAKAQELNTVWERSDRTGAENLKPDWFTVGSVRGAAYGVVNGNERFYAADRENNTIRVMDAETGADIVPNTPFDLSGVSGGTFGMNDVEVSDDGVIFLGNLASAESPFQLYWWTEEGGAFAGSVSIDVAGRVGDKFSVVGSVADNTVEVWLPVASSDPGIVHVATTDDQGANWDIETITLSGDNASIPASPDAYPLDLGRSSDFYVAANGKSPTRFTSSGAYVADSQFPASSFTGSRNGFEAFKLNGEDHLAVYTYRPDGVDTGNKTGRVYVYNVSDATSPVTVAESPMIGDDVDTFSSIHGVAQVRINDDGTYNVFALEGVNGFATFTNADLPAEPLAGDYYIPQGDNPQGFGSLSVAFDAVTQAGLSGATTFYITDNLDETGNVVRVQRNDLSESAGLTIKPAPGTSPTITVAANNSADDENESVGLLILESNWITIDGSNEMGGNTRDLTITSSDNEIGGNGLISVYGGSANNTIKNTNITYSGDATATSGIRARRNNAATGGIVNLLVQNNQIGTAETPFGDGLRLWGNAERPNNTSAINNEIYANHRGITTFWNLDNVYDGNKIWIVNPREDQGFYAGIYLVLTSGETTIVNNEFKALAVNRTAEATYAGGIVFNATLGPHTVANNTFAIPAFENTGAATGNRGYGIVLNNAAGDSDNMIYHNTFRLSASSDIGTLAAVGIEDVESTVQNWDFVNNIFTVEHNADNALVYSWPTNLDRFNSNYNNYDINATAGLAVVNGDNFNDLTDWKDTGNDANGSEAQVEFVSATDLRLTGGSIGNNDLAGTPLVTVTTDIDGTVRSELAPYKGAFEGDVELIGDGQIGAFALLSPEDGFELELMSGDPETEVVISWEEPLSNDTVTYTWHADNVDGDFSEPLLSIPSDESGTETTLTLNFQTIDTALSGLGVEEGETAELIWTVTAETDGSVRFANEPFNLSITRNLGVSNEISENPKQFTLSQNYPNPFNPTSTIEFTLPAAVDVRLDVYNISGQLVSTLVDSRMNAGQHSILFDASNLASGVYLYRIRAGNFMETKQMTLIK